MANTSYNTVTVTATATQIIAGDSQRKGLIIHNNSSATVYVGPDASITTANAIPILANNTLIMSGFQEAYRGPLYGIVATGTADVRYFDWGQ